MLFGRFYGLIYATFGGIFLLPVISKKCLFNQNVMRYTLKFVENVGNNVGSFFLKQGVTESNREQ